MNISEKKNFSYLKVKDEIRSVCNAQPGKFSDTAHK